MKLKKIIFIVLAIVSFAACLAGAYLYGFVEGVLAGYDIGAQDMFDALRDQLKQNTPGTKI